MLNFTPPTRVTRSSYNCENIGEMGFRCNARSLIAPEVPSAVIRDVFFADTRPRAFAPRCPRLPLPSCPGTPTPLTAINLIKCILRRSIPGIVRSFRLMARPEENSRVRARARPTRCNYAMRRRGSNFAWITSGNIRSNKSKNNSTPGEQR